MPHDSIAEPSMSIVVPTYNEERYIQECLSALANQDYPAERMEVLVVDGMSTDRTREIVGRFTEQDPRVKLLDNPKRLTAAGLNVGIRAAGGDLIVRVDGHQIVEPDYCSKCAEYLVKTRADCVGGPAYATGTSFWGRVIAIATSSRVGVGDATARCSTVEGWVDDTVFCCTFPRRLFDRMGLYEERWRCNEDDEFNFRLRKSGGKVYFTPEIRSRYYTRSSLSGLWRQYFRYGYWKVRVFQRHPQTMRLRHFAPLMFVLGLLGSGLLALFWSPFAVPFWAILGCYVAFLLLSSIVVSRNKGWKYVFALPATWAVLHLSYGTGFVAGLVAFAGKWGKDG